MAQFLFWIGTYNVIGSIMLACCLHAGAADLILRRMTYMVSDPYVHGAFSRTWMLWAASVNLGLGVVMMYASRWGVEPMRVVTLASVAGYAIVLIAAITVSGNPKWGPGLYVGYVLWTAQIGWGVWGFAKSI